MPKGDPNTKQAKQRTYNRWREEAMKALGNAIVPAVALEFFRVVEQYSDGN